MNLGMNIERENAIVCKFEKGRLGERSDPYILSGLCGGFAERTLTKRGLSVKLLLVESNSPFMIEPGMTAEDQSSIMIRRTDGSESSRIFPSDMELICNRTRRSSSRD